MEKLPLYAAVVVTMISGLGLLLALAAGSDLALSIGPWWLSASMGLTAWLYCRRIQLV